MLDTNYLLEINNILQQSLGAHETYGSIFSILERILPFDSATLFIYDHKNEKLNVVQTQGENIIDLVPEFSSSRGSGLSSWVLKEKKPIVLSSVANSRPGKDRIFNSFLSMPLRVADKLVGVLNLGHMQPKMYTNEQKDDYSIIATQISLVMEKLSLRSNLEVQNTKLVKTLDDLQHAQDQLIEKERLAAIGEIVVTVNHEINNPLAAVIGLAEILEIMVQNGNQDKIRDSANAILKGANRIKKVTQRLTKISSSNTLEYIEGVKMTKLPDNV